MKLITTKRKYRLYDAFQKAWVSACMGATLLGMGILGAKIYYYLTYVKPLKQIEEEKLKEDLLHEGRMISEHLKDPKLDL